MTELKKLNRLIIKMSFALLFLFGMITAGCNKTDYSTNSVTPPSGGGNSNTNQVVLQGNAFSPSSITVPVGTTVTWTNKDGYAHTVTSGTPGNPDGMFDSGTMNANATYSYKFTSAGSFKYYCKIHANMQATVIVQ